MSSEKWEKYKLTELGSLARGKSKHRPRDAAFLYGGKYPFIQTGDIKNANHKIQNFTQTYSEEGVKQSKLWPKGTLCITIAANIADTAILAFPACFPDSILGFIPNTEKCDVDFMEYHLRYIKSEIQSYSIGSVQDNINLGTFEKLELTIPPLPTQRRIASILTALDDKIELNRRMNETLEGIAQALWGEWFGKYAEGEELPEGWKWGKLEQLVDFKNGKKSPERSDSYLFNVFGSNGVIGKSNTFNSAEDTIIIGRVGSYCGSLYLSKDPCWVTDNAIIAKGKIHQSDLFIFVLLNRIDLNNHKTGSGQPLINQNILGGIDIVIPPKTLIQKFDISAQPLFSKIEKNKIQSDMLAAMRDSLLPRLMQGELNL